VEPLAVPHSQFNRVARQLNERSPETLGFETQAERVLMLVLRRPIEPTVISRHWGCPINAGFARAYCEIITRHHLINGVLQIGLLPLRFVLFDRHVPIDYIRE
jgi:hypothetical protein